MYLIFQYLGILSVPSEIRHDERLLKSHVERIIIKLKCTHTCIKYIILRSVYSIVDNRPL